MPFVRKSAAIARTICGSSFLLMVGCASFAPSASPPAVAIPARYAVPDAAAATSAAAPPSAAAQGEQVPTWWMRYGSPALDALVQEGLQRSPDLATLQHNLDAARQQLRAQVGGSTLPSVDAGASGARQRQLGLPGISPPTSLYDSFVGQLQVGYTLDLFHANRDANRASAYRVDAQAYQLAQSRRALAANIVTAAITIASLHEQIMATQRLVALSENQAGDARRRYALGAVGHDEALEAERSAAATAINLPMLRQQEASARHALAVLLGRTPDQAPAPIALAALAVPQQIPVLVPSDLLHARPDIQAAEALFGAASADVGAATARMFPQLSLSAQFGRGAYDWDALGATPNIWRLGASLTAPIFHGGALRAQRRGAQDAFAAAAEQYRKTVLAAFQDVADALVALEADAGVLDAATRATAAARSGYEDMARRAQLGAVSEYAMRASELQYRSMQLDQIRAQASRLSDSARLFRALGTPPSDAAADGGGGASPSARASIASGAADPSSR
ncbi:efflux transporter outer membrane subunit [Xanthomonas sp. NCPPB 3005]|jgi:NodT family efflux transporter outer membrane factor (OMF) lipoprotein|uniref:efflux transporter outer membrane subunit n=1 Tax=Xanthomonas sp. NCPPB 3005 TaxID=3240913 RepID=UPI0035138211